VKFEKGKSGNPSGLPKRNRGHQPGVVSGRMQALRLLDEVLGKSKSKRKLTTALETELKDHPIDFFKTIIMPLLPKESKLSIGNDGIVEWKSLVEAFPKPAVVIDVIPNATGVLALPSQKETAGSGGVSTE